MIRSGWDSLPGGRASLALPRAILRVAAEKAGVRKNARFAHIMVNFGLVVREKRFSTHETVLRIRHGSIILAHSVWETFSTHVTECSRRRLDQKSPLSIDSELSPYS